MGLARGSGTIGWRSGVVFWFGWGCCWDGRWFQSCWERHLADGAPAADTQKQGEAVETQIVVVTFD